jgi:large subunit ribosomal protein L20
MPRVKGGTQSRQKHKKVLKLAKGYRGTRNRLYKRAAEATVRAGEHAFFGRKQKRRDLRRLWISRLSGALSQYEINYSRFINALAKAEIKLDRKTLSEMAISDPKAFGEIVKQALAVSKASK